MMRRTAPTPRGSPRSPRCSGSRRLNTIAVLDRSGRPLRRTEQPVFNLSASETSPGLQAVEAQYCSQSWLPTKIRLRSTDKLFARIDELHRSAPRCRCRPSRCACWSVASRRCRAGGLSGGPVAVSEIVSGLLSCRPRFAKPILADESEWYLRLNDEADCTYCPRPFVPLQRVRRQSAASLRRGPSR